MNNTCDFKRRKTFVCHRFLSLSKLYVLSLSLSPLSLSLCVFVSHDTFLKLLWMSFRTSWVISFVCYILRKPVLLFSVCTYVFVRLFIRYWSIKHAFSHIFYTPADLYIYVYNSQYQNQNAYTLIHKIPTLFLI